MRHEVVISGFGGQGAMVMGQLLTYAGMLEGKKVSWMPSYGPEMRGGTANCSVIIDEKPIGAPMVSEPTSSVVLNLPSFDKFEPKVKAGGSLIVNSSLVDRESHRENIKAYNVPMNEIAAELGNPKMLNMVAIGALVAATGIVSVDSVVAAFAKKFASKPKVIEANKEAIQRGYDAVANTTNMVV